MKNVLEPIFEADFYPVSYGFRIGRGAHGALQHLRVTMRPNEVRAKNGRVCRLPYQWVIEGDIRGCFDNISHHGLMMRLRRRVGDPKVNRLVLAFLKAGALSEAQFMRTDDGTPQGGILSPLLANIALSAIEERYERYVWPRHTPTPLTNPQEIMIRAQKARGNAKFRGQVVFHVIRYADDFIILVGAPPGSEQYQRARMAALQEKEELAKMLKETLSLDLSETKTLITPVTDRLRFLGHHLCVRPRPDHGRLVSTSVIPRDRSKLLRKHIKGLFTNKTCNRSLSELLGLLNPVLRGWAYFYRHAWGAKKVFRFTDHYVWWTILRWLRKKHYQQSMWWLRARYGRREPGKRTVRWGENGAFPFLLYSVRVRPYKLGWLTTPDFATHIYGKPSA